MIRKLRPIPTLEEFQTQLHRHKFKATRQRLAVHEVMMELVHASGDMVCEKLRERGAAISDASVYNILSQLADAHIYAHRVSATGKMFFDVDPTRHLHLYDRVHHKYRNVEDEELNALITSRLKRRKFKGYSVEDIEIQFIAKPTRKK